jgi:hypothetical protein
MNETYKLLLGISQNLNKKNQLCHFTDEQLNDLKAILIDHRDGFTDDQWKTVFC